MKKEQENKAVLLPVELYRKIEQRIKAVGFHSVEEYVAFVLEEVVKEEESASTFSEEDEAEVKKRLKALGYLD